MFNLYIYIYIDNIQIIMKSLKIPVTIGSQFIIFFTFQIFELLHFFA